MKSAPRVGAPMAVGVHLREGREARARGDLVAAARSLRRAVARSKPLSPSEILPHSEILALAWAELGQVLLAQGEDDDAAICYRRALRFAWPHHLESRWPIVKRVYAAIARQPPELDRPQRLATEAPRRLSIADAPRALALTNLGQVLLHAERRVDGAASCFERASELDPDCGDAWVGLAEVAREDAPERAEPLLRRALDLLPEQRPRLRWELLRLRAELCDWRRWDADVDELGQFVATAEVEIPPFDLNHFPISPHLHLRAARRHAANLARARRGHVFRHPAPAPSARQRRRVAYLSPDFRSHAVGRLIWDLFRHHDRERFEIFAYSLVHVDDAYRQAIEDGCEHFVDLSDLTPARAARRIHSDRIDILVDMGGYSSHTRPQILAFEPAPVQISWLGYPDTLGAPWVPWVIADDIVMPAELAAQYREEALLLPGSFIAASPITLPPAAERGAHGLPEKGFVFASFNHPTRIRPDTFDLWMRILRRVPESFLWLYDRGIGAVSQNLRLAADARGVDPRRLVFAGYLPREQHLARLQLAQVYLDTLGYNGGATTIDALRAGVPLVTWPGRTFLGRMGASLCRAAGTMEGVAASVTEYEAIAVRLAGHPAELAALRGRLSTGIAASALFDLRRFVGDLEKVYSRSKWSGTFAA